jgi:hypothetical protein
MSKSASFEAAEGNHPAEDQRPDSHYPSTHFIGNNRLHRRVRGGKEEHHAEPGAGEAKHRDRQVAIEGKDEQHRGKQPDTTKGQLARRNAAANCRRRKGAGEGADAARA